MNFSDIVIETAVSDFFQENCYIVHQKGQTECFAVDPGLEPAKILNVIENSGLKLTAVLATHGHADHIGGIGLLKEKFPEMLIYIGEQDKDMLTDAELNLSGSVDLPFTVPPADIILTGGEKLEIAGISVEILSVPGHTRGHLAYLIPSEPQEIIFIGDVIIQNSIGRTDFPGGNFQTLMNSIQQKVLTLPDETVIYSGHGRKSTLAEEKRYNHFLKNL